MQDTLAYLLVVSIRFSVVNTQVKPCLEKLRGDSDADVQYYAVEAIDCEFQHNKLLFFTYNKLI